MPTREELESIGDIIFDEAESRFATCKAEKDFCIQSISCESVVFGGSNRVVFHIRTGWRIETNYCTKRFIENWINNF